MNKFLSMLGLARRAGKLTAGYDAAVESVRSGSSKGLVAAADISPKTEKNLRFEAEKQGLLILKSGSTIQEISIAIGKKAGVISIDDKGFFQAVSKILTATNEEDTRGSFEKG